MIEYLIGGALVWWFFGKKGHSAKSASTSRSVTGAKPYRSYRTQNKPIRKIKQRNTAPITLTDEFKEAYTLLNETDQSLFITGKAGTGKSTFLEYFRGNTKKNVIVLAPTGMAAVNIQGETIHSFFKFRPIFMEPGKPRYARADLRKLYQAIDVLVIDEISMVRADLFDAIENFLRINGKRKGESFGGCQVCILGDLHQLPPVITKEDRDVYYRYYKSPYFFDAAAFSAISFKFLELTKIFRQSDVDFINFLNRVRIKTATSEHLAWFNQAAHGRVQDNYAIVLTSTNRIADHTNQDKLDQLSTSPVKYEGTVKGELAGSGQKLLAPMDLTLKVGAQVMFLKNDKDKRWVNGTIGTVDKLEPSKIAVAVDGFVYEVDRESWESIRYEYDEEEEKIVEMISGSFEQFPLQLAWAITIHKSQGKTFDSVVINLGDSTFAPGQAYVALSRCRTLEGISLVNPLKESDVEVDDNVVEFMTRLKLPTIC